MLRWVAMLLFFSGPLCAQGALDGQGPDVKSEGEFPASRANPLLRQAVSVNCPYAAGPGTRRGSVDFIFREEWIDNQVDHFVKTIDSRLKKIRTLLTDANASRDLFLAAPSETSGLAAKRRWVQSLRGLEEEARSLRVTLANAFPAMRLKDNLKISLGPQSDAQFYQVEMNLLGDFVTSAEGKIRDYLFKPTHVADIGDLRGENMLTFLNRIERLSKKVRSEQLSTGHESGK